MIGRVRSNFAPYRVTVEKSVFPLRWLTMGHASSEYVFAFWSMQGGVTL